jgi:phytoene dehydrogenase-like protein
MAEARPLRRLQELARGVERALIGRDLFDPGDFERHAGLQIGGAGRHGGLSKRRRDPRRPGRGRAEDRDLR